MPRSPDFFRQLNEQTLEALEEFARQPGRVGPDVHAWLAERSVNTSLRSVYRWLEDFRLEDRAHRAAESRVKYLELSDKLDPTNVAKATHRLLAERIYELAVNADDADTVNALTRSFQRTTDVMEQLEERDRRMAAAVTGADEAARSGASGEVVANKVREILNIK